MAAREVIVKGGKEARFLGALGGALHHARAHIVDHPAIGDGHMADIGTLVDQHDTILAELPVGTAILHIAGNVKLILRTSAEIADDGRSEERRVGKECRSRWS